MKTFPNSASPPRQKRFNDQRDWFFEKRFGLFVHWGLYALNGWHEQHQWRARVPRGEYVRLAQSWNPQNFDPDAWLDAMEDAGMKYICLTTKHHEGFCLWNTAQTDFNTMNTPYGRDIVGMLAQACQRRGVPLCLYYSVVDWHHPHYPNQGRHHELPPQPGDAPDWEKYVVFLREQVRELCSNYGPLHGFWWDMNVPEAIDRSINDLIRQLQPAAVINNRGFDEGDFGTPERDFEEADETGVFGRPVEACQSVGMESWGFRRDEDFYTDRHLQRSIAKYLARDANYLLNVGPDADGAIAPESAALLKRIGNWYRATREAFENVEPASHGSSNRDVLLTRRDNTLYVVLHRDPVGDAVKLKPIQLAPQRATLLNTGQKVEWALDVVPSEHVQQGAFLRLRRLPVNALCNTVLVVKLEFDDLSGLATSSAQANQADGLIR
ncbi:MAG: alpha-L-fucosidase [Armatimonadetes bacterium]|nr:alpha-L-fucosidase [Armatimonadota bacterium]